MPTLTRGLLAIYGMVLFLVCVVVVWILTSRQRERLVGTWLAVTLGTFGVASAIQIRTWHGRGSWVGNPDNKVFFASWMASELWVNPGLLVVGVITGLAGVAFYLAYPRLPSRS